MKKQLLFLTSIFCVMLLQAQMRMPQSNLPRFNRWLNNDEFVINTKLKAGAPSADYVYNIITKAYTPAPAAVLKEEATVSLKSGEVVIKVSGVETVLTSDKGDKKNPQLSPDGQFVGYTKDNNLYTVGVADKKVTAITSEKERGILNGYASWVYFEEIFGRATQYRAFWWSPDSKYISFMRFDEEKVPMFPIYNSEGLHGFVEETRYPKVGDPNPTVKIGWSTPTGGKITWADFNDQEDQYFGWPIWNPNNKSMWLPWMDRGQNNLKIYELDMTSGAKKEVYQEYQKTWIDLEDRVNGRINFIANNEGYIAQSDASGWNQLYLYDMNGQLINPITNGKYTVTGIKLIDENHINKKYVLEVPIDDNLIFSKIFSNFDSLCGRFVSCVWPYPTFTYVIMVALNF